jgi:DNA polymerase-3 subunit gamma/tau
MSPEPPPWLDLPPGEGFAAEPDSANDASDLPQRQARAPVPMAVTRAGSTPAALVRTPTGDRWDGHVRTLLEQGSISALVRELALQAQCIAIDGQVWRLRVERESLFAPAHRDRLQAALRESLGEPVTLQVELGATEDTPARREAAERARRQQHAEQIIHDDPLVQALMSQYATARIVPGSVKPH